MFGVCRTAAILVAAMVTALAGAGCGGSSETTSTPAAKTAAAASSATLQAAKDAVAKLSAEQPPIEVEPLPERPPSGRTLAVLTCGFPTCKLATDGAADGAKALGWKVRTYTSEITPEGYVATWNRMLQDKPDAIVFTGLMPNSLIKDQLAQVEQQRIPTVSISSSSPPAGPVQGDYIGAPQRSESGKLMADAVVADGGTGGDTLFVWDPKSEPIFGAVKRAFEDGVNAAGGAMSVLEIATSDVGTAVPGQVVSYLQAHPNVRYLAFAIADFSAGVPQALKAAGIDDVKLVSRSPTATNVENLQKGLEWVEVAEEQEAGGYRAMDAIVRILAGVPHERSPVGWHRILTADTVTDPGTVLETPGSPEAFLRAWHVGG